MKRVSKNIEETAGVAKIFLNKILKDKGGREGATIICLSGNLGAGKTAFTQAVAKHLGIKNKVASPTFVIMKKYPLKAQKHQFLFHLDAYRLKSEKELLNLGWKEVISDKSHLAFVEWPEDVKKAIPKEARYVYISHGEQGKRIFEL
jgi:tRNA threonylcarbamoyladenosine biosynthesis protein TsaE